MTDRRPVPITLPDLGAPRVALGAWYARPGDRVFEGDRVAEVVLPGATFDVPAPATGVLRARAAFRGDPLAPGQVLGVVEEEQN